MIDIEWKEDILDLAQDKCVYIDFGEFSVALGNNGLYYLGLSNEIKCIDNCESPEDCHCVRMYPNSMSFKTPLEVIDFITLNLFNGQAEYKEIV